MTANRQGHTGTNAVNTVLRKPADFEAPLQGEIEGRVAIVHPLKFRARAASPDRRTSDLTGPRRLRSTATKWSDAPRQQAEAWSFREPRKHLVLCEAEELWDEVLAVEFPSNETFVELTSAPDLV